MGRINVQGFMDDWRRLEAKRLAALAGDTPKPETGQSLTPRRPFLAQAEQRVRVMPEAAATVLPFPSDRAEAPAVRLALASILATGRQTQLETARCGVNMRRALAGLKSLEPREGAPSPVKAIEELQRACGACGGCRGI